MMPVPVSTSILVRLATPADAAPLAELSSQLGYPVTPEQVASRLRRLTGDPLHGVFVAELPEPGDSAGGGLAVIGWVHVQERHLIETEVRAEVTAMVVGEGHRRRGAGRVLMAQAEQWARERGCEAVILRSNVIRAWAHAFYDALGYRILKTQKVFLKEL
jgi:GNAT superfamily N-acetyltransferase